MWLIIPYVHIDLTHSAEPISSYSIHLFGFQLVLKFQWLPVKLKKNAFYLICGLGVGHIGNT